VMMIEENEAETLGMITRERESRQQRKRLKRENSGECRASSSRHTVNEGFGLF
jgi:hypothetical protein